MKKLFEALKEINLGSFKVVNNIIDMGDLKILVMNEFIIMYYGLDCRPDKASKISMLVFAFSKDTNRSFSYGKVFAYEYDSMGNKGNIILGEDAVKVHEKNIQRKQHDSYYYEFILKMVDENSLHSC